MINEIQTIRSFLNKWQCDGYELNEEQRNAVREVNSELRKMLPTLSSNSFRYGTMGGLTVGSEWDLQVSLPGLDMYCHVSVAETRNGETAYMYFDPDHKYMFCLW